MSHEMSPFTVDGPASAGTRAQVLARRIRVMAITALEGSPALRSRMPQLRLPAAQLA